MVQASLQIGPSKLQADSVFGKKGVARLWSKKSAVQEYHRYPPPPLYSMHYGYAGPRVFWYQQEDDWCEVWGAIMQGTYSDQVIYSNQFSARVKGSGLPAHSSRVGQREEYSGRIVFILSIQVNMCGIAGWLYSNWDHQVQVEFECLAADVGEKIHSYHIDNGIYHSDELLKELKAKDHKALCTCLDAIESRSTFGHLWGLVLGSRHGREGRIWWVGVTMVVGIWWSYIVLFRVLLYCKYKASK